MNQIERIESMEKLYDNSRAVIDELSSALAKYASIRKDLLKLEKYYTSDRWLKDYDDMSAGKLPSDLKCGILSEDGIYDLLNDDTDLVKTMLDEAKKYISG
ncbi:MAG: DUF4298 domain-containing protein [Clostridiales bacterium]|nr:DUF4298 domain-containing protein [Clostridiales bacterium]